MFFSSKLYLVGINPCVKVPRKITDELTPEKGYIPVKGKIEAHPFRQTLVPVKNAPYRLYVNGPMMKGAGVKLGQIVTFQIEQDFTPKEKSYPMNRVLSKELRRNRLTNNFKKLTATRQKDILKYLNFLKTEEALLKNIAKVIVGLKNGNPRIP